MRRVGVDRRALASSSVEKASCGSSLRAAMRFNSSASLLGRQRPVPVLDRPVVVGPERLMT